jgi:glutathione S-transferase
MSARRLEIPMDDTQAQAEALCRRIAGIGCDTVRKPTLLYFDVIGIAWPIRCMLHLGGIDYDLIQMSIVEWGYRDDAGRPIVKRSFRNGHVPRYVDRDVDLNDSRLIMNYLAERTGMMPEAPEQQIAVGELIGHGYDALFGFRGILPVNVKLAIPDDVVRARLEAFMGAGQWGILSGGYHGNLQTYSDYLAANDSQSGFLVGDRLSLADLHAFNVLGNWYKAFDREAFTNGFPDLDAYIRRVAAIPGVREYIDHHQEATTWFSWPDAAIRLTSPEELRGLV